MLCGVGLRHLLHFIFRSSLQQCPYLGMGLGEQLHDSFLPHNSLRGVTHGGRAGQTMTWGSGGEVFQNKKTFCFTNGLLFKSLLFSNIHLYPTINCVSFDIFNRFGLNNQSCNRHDPVHMSESSKRTELIMHEVTLNQPIRAI